MASSLNLLLHFDNKHKKFIVLKKIFRKFPNLEFLVINDAGNYIYDFDSALLIRKFMNHDFSDFVKNYDEQDYVRKNLYPSLENLLEKNDQFANEQNE